MWRTNERYTISAKHWEKAMLQVKRDMEDEMKISNAIRNVESVFSNSPDIVSEETIKSCEIAIAAMEKQDPMKVHGDYSCVCGHDLGLDRPTPNYCPQCGQNLDWGTED